MIITERTTTQLVSATGVTREHVTASQELPLTDALEFLALMLKEYEYPNNDKKVFSIELQRKSHWTDLYSIELVTSVDLS